MGDGVEAGRAEGGHHRSGDGWAAAAVAAAQVCGVARFTIPSLRVTRSCPENGQSHESDRSQVRSSSDECRPRFDPSGLKLRCPGSEADCVHVCVPQVEAEAAGRSRGTFAASPNGSLPDPVPCQRAKIGSSEAGDRLAIAIQGFYFDTAAPGGGVNRYALVGQRQHHRADGALRGMQRREAVETPRPPAMEIFLAGRSPPCPVVIAV